MGELDTNAKINRMIDDVNLIFPLFHRALVDPQDLTHNPTSSEFRVMMILVRRSAQPISTVGRWLGISKPNMTAVVDKLIADGYVERSPSAEDRRVIEISITEKGKRHMEACRSEAQESMKKRLSKLSAQDIDTLYYSLENIRQTLMKLNGMNDDTLLKTMKIHPPWEGKP